MDNEFSTPMMRQYVDIKKQYPDCLLLFRLGDFYELFLDDAKIGSNILGITLTSRSRGSDGRIPMAGVPYHAVDAYLSKLVKAGYKVAICEQLSAPNGKDLVKRDVIRIVTPGTVLDEKSLNENENNYIACIVGSMPKIGIAFTDLSTGFLTAGELQISTDTLQTVLANQFSLYRPSECVISESLYADTEFIHVLKKFDIPLISKFSFQSNEKTIYEYIKSHFGLKVLDGFGISKFSLVQLAVASVLKYLKDTQKNNIDYINSIKLLGTNDCVVLDSSTINNLELFANLKRGDASGSLVSILNTTITCLGARMLKRWVSQPLKNVHSINDRYDFIADFMANPSVANNVSNLLAAIIDIERLLSRICLGFGNARDLLGLKVSLNACLEILPLLQNFESSIARDICNGGASKLHTPTQNNLNINWSLIEHLVQKIDSSILDDPAIDTKNGGLIKSGVNTELDTLRAKVVSDKSWIANLEALEKDRTGISSLKIRFNEIFGYYIEVTKSNLGSVPDHFIRRQTLVNAERFITPELKEYEESILIAREKINQLELEIFQELVENVISLVPVIQEVAHNIATIDCILCFANVSTRYNYVRPTIVASGDLNISDGRHPVVERMLDLGAFVPNDSLLDHTSNNLLLLTGPNMAGKSVYIRQVAIIVLLAHIGCFVPASKAQISLVDRIFVRSGASDFISSGLSTFMVEMVETAFILNNATEKSLIVMDEIGRGTSTYDGISIAQAVAEYLVQKGEQCPKTLFATHYHELQTLEDNYPDKVKNYEALVQIHKENPVFLHKVVPGKSSNSYGIAVAQMSGLPNKVIVRAKEILKGLRS